eukprot:CAMPEP_0197922094 /NCGR_PEP_ID=MMETSP1439-20131203/91767_1 /TAXON_ID=66791 /ORGANISM="Gonyaulax spinifera, Strain CCMP409" /LENGTH=188 /DNA_ID=CAMNT_0043544383 /DNA_START=304 /DNA_END=869 /DNA_ORIENTATION=+
MAHAAPTAAPTPTSAQLVVPEDDPAPAHGEEDDDCQHQPEPRAEGATLAQEDLHGDPHQEGDGAQRVPRGHAAAQEAGALWPRRADDDLEDHHHQAAQPEEEVAQNLPRAPRPEEGQGYADGQEEGHQRVERRDIMRPADALLRPRELCQRRAHNAAVGARLVLQRPLWHAGLPHDVKDQHPHPGSAV